MIIRQRLFIVIVLIAATLVGGCTGARSHEPSGHGGIDMDEDAPAMPDRDPQQEDRDDRDLGAGADGEPLGEPGDASGDSDSDSNSGS